MNSNGAKSFLVLCVCRVVLQSIDCLCHTAIQTLELMKLNVDCTSIKLGCSICVCVMFALDIASCQCNGLPFLWISLFISEVSDERWRTRTPFIERIKCCDDKKNWHAFGQKMTYVAIVVVAPLQSSLLLRFHHRFSNLFLYCPDIHTLSLSLSP